MSEDTVKTNGKDEKDSSKPKIHLISSDPRNTDLLDRCLKASKPNDILYFVGDGVNVFLDENLFEKVSNYEVYVSEYDVTARAIPCWCSEEISADKIVELVTKYGSPITWKNN